MYIFQGNPLGFCLLFFPFLPALDGALGSRHDKQEGGDIELSGRAQGKGKDAANTDPSGQLEALFALLNDDEDGEGQL